MFKKVTVALFFIFISTNNLFGQENFQIEKLTEVDEQPYPLEGNDAFYQYIAKELAEKFPRKAQKKASKMGIEGIVYVEFIVERNGKLSNVLILKGIGGGCDEVAQNILENYEKLWQPAKLNGRTVRCRMILPINFKLV